MVDPELYSTIAECIIGLWGSATNLMVLLAIYKERRLRTITNCFVGSLALSDLSVSLFIPPIVLASFFGLVKGFTICVLLQGLTVVFTQISVFNLLTIALDRFCAIRIPFHYKTYMTIDRALKIVAFTWVLAIAIGMIPVMGWNRGEEDFTVCAFWKVINLDYMVKLIFLGFTVPPLVIMFIVYIYIFVVVRRTRVAIKQLMGEHRIGKRITTHMRGDVSIIMVIIMYVVCWMPFHAVNCFVLWSRSPVPTGVFLTTLALTHVNSVCNPFLFAFGYRLFKITIKRILFGLCMDIPDPEISILQLPHSLRQTHNRINLSITFPGCGPIDQPLSSSLSHKTVIHMLGTTISFSETNDTTEEVLDTLKSAIDSIARTPFKKVDALWDAVRNTSPIQRKRETSASFKPKARERCKRKSKGPTGFLAMLGKEETSIIASELNVTRPSYSDIMKTFNLPFNILDGTDSTKDVSDSIAEGRLLPIPKDNGISGSETRVVTLHPVPNDTGLSGRETTGGTLHPERQKNKSSIPRAVNLWVIVNNTFSRFRETLNLTESSSSLQTVNWKPTLHTSRPKGDACQEPTPLSTDKGVAAVAQGHGRNTVE